MTSPAPHSVPVSDLRLTRRTFVAASAGALAGMAALSLPARPSQAATLDDLQVQASV